MAPNTQIFDQIYEVLVNVRSEVRLNYDIGHTDFSDKVLYFCLNDKQKPLRCEDDDENSVSVIVSWEDNNETLRTLARNAMNELVDKWVEKKLEL